MSLAFFAKGFGNLGWCVLSDTSPKEMLGIAGGVFNMCGGNLASSIISPLVIGVILADTHSFDYAILYVGSHGRAGPVLLSVYRWTAGSLDASPRAHRLIDDPGEHSPPLFRIVLRRNQRFFSRLSPQRVDHRLRHRFAPAPQRASTC